MGEAFAARRVLITGAGGSIGSVLREGLKGRYDLLRLLDVKPLSDAGPGEELVTADIQKFDELVTAMADMDCVVHLAGVADEDVWERILPLTIGGCYNVFEAARQAGVKRVIYASSNHAVGFHRRNRSIDTEVMVRPDGRYGVSKAFGEALGRMYADKYAMSVACMRIGSFRAKPEDRRQLMTWISHRDMVHLAERCIDHPDYHYAIVYGVSDNERNVWDNSKVDWLGFRPRDNAETYAPELLAKEDGEDPIAKVFHGGSFVSREFTGDIDLID